MSFPANGFALAQLHQAAQGQRLTLLEKDDCAKGVSESLQEAGFTFGKEQARPLVSTGFIGPNVWDYGKHKWIPIRGADNYAPIRSVVDKAGPGDAPKVRGSDRDVEAKYFGHTLEMYGFRAILGIFGGPHAKKKDIEAMNVLPPGSIVIFGPCPAGGAGHPGHIGILVPQVDEAGKTAMVVVSDGGMRKGPQSARHRPKKGKKGEKSPVAGAHFHFLDDCILKYQWAVGFIPSEEPHNLVACPRDYPEDYPMRRLPFTRTCDSEPQGYVAPPPPGWSRQESDRILRVLGLPRSSAEPMSRDPHFDPSDVISRE